MLKIYIPRNSFLLQAHPKNSDHREGYATISPDGQVGWIEKEIFETTYRELTDREREIL